jgi:hypothetical protein
LLKQVDRHEVWLSEFFLRWPRRPPRSSRRRVTDRHGNEIGGDSSPDRILACSGLCALVEKNGIRGCWRHLCSNQVTNCS